MNLIGYAISNDESNRLKIKFPDIQICDSLNKALIMLENNDTFVIVNPSSIGATAKIILVLLTMITKISKFICLDLPSLNLDLSKQKQVTEYLLTLSRYENSRRKTQLSNLFRFRGKNPKSRDSIHKKTTAKIAQVIKLYLAGISLIKLCKETKITANTVYKILKLKKIPLRSSIY